MEKKKVLFVCYGLGIGGIEKCLVNLLNVIHNEDYDVDVLLMTSEEELKETISNKNVHFLDSFCYVMSIEDTPIEIRKHGGWSHCLGKSLSYVHFRIRVKLKHNKANNHSENRQSLRHSDLANF